jgi:hypothetical protein
VGASKPNARSPKAAALELLKNAALELLKAAALELPKAAALELPKATALEPARKDEEERINAPVTVPATKTKARGIKTGGDKSTGRAGAAGANTNILSRV